MVSCHAIRWQELTSGWQQTGRSKQTNSYPILLQGRERRLEERRKKSLTYASNKLPSCQVFFFFPQTAYLAVFLTATLLHIVPILELHILYNMLLPLTGPEQANKKSTGKERTCHVRTGRQMKWNVPMPPCLLEEEFLNIGIMTSINNGSRRLCSIKATPKLYSHCHTNFCCNLRL